MQQIFNCSDWNSIVHKCSIWCIVVCIQPVHWTRLGLENRFTVIKILFVPNTLKLFELGNMW